MTYSKYSANGNDFVIFHTFIKKDYSNEAKQLCDRKFGLGADGLIVIVPNEQYDFEWLFYNSDGSTASMCGNGTRACALYAYQNNLVSSKNIEFLTIAGAIKCEVFENNHVQTQFTQQKIINESFYEDGFEWFLCDTGVPHLVTVIENLNSYDKKIASKLRHKYNANVNFCKIEDKKLYVRTYERGVEDETLACGTGMAACFLKALSLKKVDENSCCVYPTSGEELIFSLKNENILFKGEVKYIFTTTL